MKYNKSVKMGYISITKNIRELSMTDYFLGITDYDRVIFTYLCDTFCAMKSL